MNKPDLDIIKSPEAERMRQMVTEGFYDRSRIGLWMFEVIGREYDDMAEWSQTIRLEAFPQTCTWSIGIWEFIYGIESDVTLPLDYRRQQIIARKQSRPPINPARLEHLLELFTGANVSIEELVGAYTLHVSVNNPEENINYGDLRKYIRKLKPAHLSFDLRTYIKHDAQLPLHIGTAGSRHTTIHHGVAMHGINGDAKMNIGVGLFEKRVYTHEPIPQ